MSILNAAHCGFFSSDRSVREYAGHIWQVRPVDVASWRQSAATPHEEDGGHDAQRVGIELTDAEWTLLVTAPGAISSAMLTVADSGLIGTVLEKGAGAWAPALTARRYTENPLIRAVQRQLKTQTRTFRPTYQMRPLPHAEVRQRPRVEPSTRGGTELLALCGQIADLLERKVPPPQAHEFKAWLLAIGEAMANAAAEGGFVTVGGATTSEREATMLQAMRHALRVP